MTTIQELAKRYYDMFEIAERTNGEKFWRVKSEFSDKKDYYENDPLAKLIHSIHAKMLPDDYIYEYIVNSFDLISESDCEDNLYDLPIEADIYHSDLLKWVDSHPDRLGRCDEALSFGEGAYNSIIDIIQSAQQYEKQEVLNAVISWLEDHDELNNDEEI